ncbi:MAG: hypothetical protein E3K36_11590 [Candidatus Brocadia sp.]|nr:hypothetical protein [Candidatus Brocadia sp.]
MKPILNSIVKTVFTALYLLLLSNIVYPVFTVQSQDIHPNGTSTIAQAQSTQVPPPELPPTPRSKLEIIQYILLPFAIGASIWLILRLEKMEREQTKGNEGQ